MVTVKEVNKDRIEALVRISYKDDMDGFNKYHVQPFNYESSVQKTLEQINEMELQTPLTFYEIMFHKEPIGYFVTFRQCLYSFCISKKYRTVPGVLNEWWALVKIVLGEIFVSILYINNTRAIRFLHRMGMTECESTIKDKNLIMLVNI